jgi:hypothetical protein
MLLLPVPVMVATQEAEIRRIATWAIVWEILS